MGPVRPMKSKGVSDLNQNSPVQTSLQWQCLLATLAFNLKTELVL